MRLTGLIVFCCAKLFAQSDDCMSVKKTVDQYVYTYETDFNEDKVTPIFIIRQYCLNPDYLFDHFTLYFTIAIEDTVDTDLYGKIDSTGNLIYFEHWGLSVIFQDGTSLNLDRQAVRQSWLNNAKTILNAECDITSKNLESFTSKEIDHFIFEGKYSKSLSMNASRVLKKQIVCIAGVKTVL